ncbi:hypothetical protein BGX21_002909 [Mortierella sp. AD011]|nr:hypothetical protein BGX21_002909 [Mortierella sp. AD011]
MNNKRDAYDMHRLSTLLPCGIDDVTEKDLADVGLLGPQSSLAHLTLDNSARELESGMEDELEEQAPLIDIEEKAHKRMQLNRFNDISYALTKRLEGYAPWIDIPLVREPKRFAYQYVRLQYTPKVFYLQEGTYKDWIERDGINHWFHWCCTHNEFTAADGPSDYVWYQIWGCHRCGKPHVSKAPKDPNVKHREVYKGPCKIGCDAVLFVHKFKPSISLVGTVNVSKLVRITYYSLHNHTLGNVDGFDHQSISNRLRERIRYYTSIGLSNPCIRKKLTLPIQELYRRFANGSLTRDDFIVADDIANEARRYWSEISEQDKVVYKSVCMWMTKLEEQGFFVFRAQDGVIVKSLERGKSISVGFASPWQLEKLQQSAGVIGLDSTQEIGNFRKTRDGRRKNSKHELLTVVVQDRHTLRGIPVAFLLTTDLTARPIELWLSVLSQRTKPFRYITVDDSAMERLANFVNGDCAEDSMRLRAEARQALLDVMYETDVTQALKLKQKFEDDWKERSPDFFMYITTNYLNSLDRMKTWMRAYRRNDFYAEINTHNYVESWHSLLKLHFLKRHFMSRVDRMVYLLSNVVLDYFKQEELQTDVREGHKSKGKIMDILRQREVRSFSDGVVKKHVLCIDTKYTVKSFSHPGLYYSITHDSEGRITGCSCPYFLGLRRVCKHILSSVRRYPNDLSLPAQAIFPSESANSLVVSEQENFDSKLDVFEETGREDEDGREQETPNGRILAAMETATEMARLVHCDAQVLEKVLELIEHLKTLPTKQDPHSNNKRKRQGY